MEKPRDQWTTRAHAGLPLGLPGLTRAYPLQARPAHLVPLGYPAHRAHRAHLAHRARLLPSPDSSGSPHTHWARRAHPAARQTRLAHPVNGILHSLTLRNDGQASNPTFSHVLRFFFVQLWRTCVPERNVRPVLLHRLPDEVTLRTGVSRKEGLPLASFCGDRWFASSAFSEGLPRTIF